MCSLRMHVLLVGMRYPAPLKGYVRGHTHNVRCTLRHGVGKHKIRVYIGMRPGPSQEMHVAYSVSRLYADL